MVRMFPHIAVIVSPTTPQETSNLRLSIENRFALAEPLTVNISGSDPRLIRQESFNQHNLRPLDYRPILLKDWALVTYILGTAIWITLLILTLFKRDPFRGPVFIFDGFGAGYVSTAAKFVSSLQATSLGQIMPYWNMALGKDCEGTKIVSADYYPYEWPITRPRSAINGHWVYFIIDLATMLSTLSLVQFSSNILGAVYDDDNNFVGWLPNKGIIVIVVCCHAVLLVISISTLWWLRRQRCTGLLAQPGSIITLLGMLHGSTVCKDFIGLDQETRLDTFRQRIEKKTYRIGYWERPGENVSYGIGREGDSDVGGKT
jgi:hypothetical protein